jgi:ACS family hexuronate transporter-like MFS transporter
MSAVTITRSPNWRWWVCGLLLLATMINYMDRLTLNLLAKYILEDLGMDERDYASIEAGFALAFAFGAIVCGFIVDRWNVFWVYPVAVLAWSAAGYFSGFATGFYTLLLCRVMLGVAEAANWPCALRTTQRILPPSDRAMGNSILQSGAAVGAILIPFVLFALFDEQRIETWRLPFFVVGAGGMLWVFAWWASLRPADLKLTHDTGPAGKFIGPELTPRVAMRRFFVLVILVVTINMTWHFLRAWGPLYLQNAHGFSSRDTFRFSIAYYICTDIGALTAGFVTLRLARGGLPVHSSRSLVFLAFALLTTLCILVPFLTSGMLLVAAMLVVGFGALGVFPNYYSFSQDLTTRHQGKLTGTLGCCCWMAMAGWQKGIGWLVHETGSYTVPFIISGLAPLFGFLMLLFLWGKTEETMPLTPALAPSPELPQDTRIMTRTESVQPETQTESVQEEIRGS